MFKVRNHTRLKAGESRYDRLIELANERAERFLSVNPSRRESTFIALYWKGSEYRAYVKFTSNQGTGSIATVFESEFD